MWVSLTVKIKNKTIKLKVNDKSVGLITSVYSKLTTKTPKKRHIGSFCASNKPFAVPLRKEIFHLRQVPA